jgi:hypothetical protein
MGVPRVDEECDNWGSRRRLPPKKGVSTAPRGLTGRAFRWGEEQRYLRKIEWLICLLNQSGFERL